MVMATPKPNAADAVGAVAGIAMRTRAKSRTRMMKLFRMMSPFLSAKTKILSGAKPALVLGPPASSCAYWVQHGGQANVALAKMCKGVGEITLVRGTRKR